MSWMGGVLVAIDQLGNAVAWGNPDATISARTGYFANEVETPFKLYWKSMEWIINFAFYPVDGPDHCHREYLKDKDQHNEAGSDLVRGILGIIIIISCIPISIVTRIYVLIFPSARYKEQ